MPPKHHKARRPPFEALGLRLRRLFRLGSPRALLHGPATLARRSPLALTLNLLAVGIVIGAIAFVATRLA